MCSHAVRLRRTVALGALSTLLACGGSGGDSPAAPASIQVALSSATMSLAQGGSSDVTVTVIRTNFTGDVQLSVEHSASGVSTTLASATLAAGQTQTTLTVNVGATAVAGTASLTVRARGATVSDRTASLALTVTQTAGFTLTVPAALLISPGQSGTVDVVLARTNFPSPVTLSAEGLPAGASGTFSPNPVALDASSLTISTGTAAPGSYTVTVRGVATGQTDRVATFTLSIAAPSYALSLSGATLSLQQGQGSTLNVTLDRTAFTGTVTFAVSNLPTGATAVFTPASTTGNSAVLAVNAGSAVAGSSMVTVRATAGGLADRTATFTLDVAAAPAPTAVTFDLCSPTAPVWVGYQSAGGAWVSLPVTANNVYAFSVAGVGAIAFVLPLGGASSGYETAVIYASAAELQSFGDADCALGSKTVNGSVSGVATGERAIVALGSARMSVSGVTGGTPAFTLFDVTDGPHDLVATRSVGTEATRIILTRGLDPVNGATLPVLDFASSAAVNPVKAVATVTGTGSVAPIVYSDLLTANGTVIGLSAAEGTTPNVTYSGVPTSSLQAGDLHQLFAIADESSGLRGAASYVHQALARTLALGPALSQPSLFSVASSPYVRLQLQIPSQPQYQSLAAVHFVQFGSSPGPSDRVVSLLATAGYFHGMPASWQLTIPDLAGAPGFTSSWGLAPAMSTDVYVEVDGGLAATAPVTEGGELRFATTQGTTTTSAAARYTLSLPSRASRARTAAAPRWPSLSRGRALAQRRR